MGVGLGFAIAAALWCRAYSPSKKVLCVEGDSAFGFSGMEVETMFRCVDLFLCELSLIKLNDSAAHVIHGTNKGILRTSFIPVHCS